MSCGSVSIRYLIGSVSDEQVSIGSEACQWVAYVVLLIIAIVYLALVLLLLVKIIEAVTRIIGGVGFDRSRHTVDSGLVGVCGLVGCCGSRKQRKPRQRATHSDLPQLNSQTTLPLTAPKGSTPAQSAPPSVFRPEHALRPYREENDDDTGFIMGAWRPFPRPGGYNSVGDHATPPESPAKTGFSRIGGGRSHFDTPYSIATGSMHTFPSTSADQPPTPQRDSHESNPSVTAYFPNAERRPYSSLPPGAMAPHVRRKSQSAVIEHAPVLPKAALVPSSSQLAAPPVPSSFRRHSHLSEVVSPISDDDASEVNQPAKKRHWFQLRKARRHSDGNEARPEQDVQTEKPGETGRSFVVVRDRKTSQASQPVAGGSGFGDEPSGTLASARSFVVLRGRDNSPV